MMKRERLILGLGHFVGAGALLYGAMAARYVRGDMLAALLLAGGVMGMLMMGMIWMSGDLE